MEPELSIIILSFNVKNLLLNCLKSVYKAKKKEDHWQVIVVDNDSSDRSLEAAKKAYPQIEAHQTGENLGFAKGNNFGVAFARAKTTLFLNPDTEVVDGVIQKSLKFLSSDKEIGALTCRVELPDGRLDYSCHRGFPTPWNSLTYFLGLSTLFPHWKFLAGYTASYLSTDKTHEMDCGNGAFLMVKRRVGDKIGWWDPDYFWNGEDVEFFYRVKEQGFKIYFFAEGKIIHFKGSSSGLWKTAKVEVPLKRKIKTAKHAAQAIRTFFMKHYFKKYPLFIRQLILLGIYLLEKYRIFKINKGVGYE